MVPPSGSGRVDIREELRLRVEQATAECKRANAERSRLFAISSDVLSGPDGAVAAQQAARIQLEALQRLRRALSDFEAFLDVKRLGPTDLSGG